MTHVTLGLMLLLVSTAVVAQTGDDDTDTAAVSLTIAAVGDIMLGTDYPDNHLPDDDGASFLTAAAPIVRAAHIGFGNLEGVLLDGGEAVKKCQDPRACYLFRSPTRYADHLASAGFTVMSLANNHARDFGEEGRDASMAALASRGIHHSGREGDVAVFEVHGVGVALIAFAPFKGAHDLLSQAAAESLVTDLAARADIVIVSMHAGGEAGDVRHVPFEEEMYRGENRGDVARFARGVVDAGADLVLGHGPHVPRGLEVHKGRLIAYSLGNFATYYGIRVTGDNGLAPLLVLTLDGEGALLEGRVYSFRQRRPSGPLPDPTQEALKLIRSLSDSDFPESAPRFETDGRFVPREPVVQSSLVD